MRTILIAWTLLSASQGPAVGGFYEARPPAEWSETKNVRFGNRSSPFFAGSAIYLRSERNLYCISR